MPINIVQTPKGDMELQGGGVAGVGFIPVSIPYNASSVDMTGFVADRAYTVKSIILRVTAAGTNGSAVSVQPRKVPSGTAITSGTALTSDTGDLKGTADTNQVLTLDATAVNLAAGDALALDFTGTLTTATGVVTFALTPR